MTSDTIVPEDSTPSSRERVHILATTSREPSRRTRSFIKELSQTLPYTRVFNRGKRTLVEIAGIAVASRAKFLLLIHEWKANPRRLLFYKFDSLMRSSSLDDNLSYMRFASLTLAGVKLTRELGVSGRIYNPRSIGFSIDECSSDLCFKASEVFLEIYRHYRSREPDVILDFSDNESFVNIAVMDGLGRIHGPLIKVVKVDIFE